MRTMSVTCIAVLMLTFVGAAWASQAPGHVCVALAAKNQLPAGPQSIINANLAAYLAGAAGPDIAYTAHYIKLGIAGLPGGTWVVSAHPPGTEGHEEKTGELIKNMYGAAQTDAEKAFVLGWLSHYCVDNIIHPLVNKYGGYYGTDDVRHKLLEMVESEHVFNKWAGSTPLSQYIVNAGAVPAEVVNAGYAQTYPTGANAKAYKPWIEHKVRSYGYQSVDFEEIEHPPAFVDVLNSSASSMHILTQAMVSQHNTGTYSGIWATGEMYLAVKGPPPTQEEYEKIVNNPLLIDRVEYLPPAAGSGTQPGKLKVHYTVNDARLCKPFCDEWNLYKGTAVADCASKMAALFNNPENCNLPNTDMNSGYSPFNRNDPAQAWPGNPAITEMLVQVVVTRPDGSRVPVLQPDGVTSWDPTGVWLPCHPTVGQSWGQWVGVSNQIGTKTKIWGGPAGTAWFEVPCKDFNPAKDHVSVQIGFADKKDKKPYGVFAKWEGKVPGPGSTPSPVCDTFFGLRKRDIASAESLVGAATFAH